MRVFPASHSWLNGGIKIDSLRYLTLLHGPCRSVEALGDSLGGPCVEKQWRDLNGMPIAIYIGR